MDYVALLKSDLEFGFTKSDLEQLIGLPKNNLSGVLKGTRQLSKKSKIKIDRWMKSSKPDPLEKPIPKKVIESLQESSVSEIDSESENDRVTKINEMLKLSSNMLPFSKRRILQKELDELLKK